MSAPYKTRLGQWKFEMPGNDSTYREVLIEGFPTQRCSAKLKCDILQFIVGRTSQPPETFSGESEDTAIVELDEYLPAFNPSPQRQNLFC